MKKGLTEWKLEGYIVSAYVELASSFSPKTLDN